jgi:hypothetical protein
MYAEDEKAKQYSVVSIQHSVFSQVLSAET